MNKTISLEKEHIMENTTRYGCEELFTRVCALAHKPNSPYRNRARILTDLYLNGKANMENHKVSRSTFEVLGNIMIANAERHIESTKEVHNV
jgi:hypothetical protein